ncbi:MAG TPA: acyl-CoA dehydrogenase family protein [Allosphingosinicella sp.]|nr:acyl-CoA dehydrogenase family protein [Allosphingosinicella sp.]
MTSSSAVWEERRRAFAIFADGCLAPHAAAADRSGRLPDSVIDSLRHAGFLGSPLPTGCGGGGLDPPTYGLLTAEIARACSSCRTLMTVHDMVAATLLRWGSAQLKADVLPELAAGRLLGAFALSEMSAGSNSGAIQTIARREGDELVLTGAKAWTSFGLIADLFLVFATIPAEGAAALLVPADTPGLSKVPVPDMAGTRAAMMAHLELDECRIPAAALVGRPGFGLSHVAQTALDHGRYSVAWGAVGIADAALDAAVRYSRERSAFGGVLADRPAVRASLVRMAAGARSARLMCMDAGRARVAQAQDSITRTMLAKYFSSKAAVDCANAAVQLHGARGLLTGSVPERLLRDSKVTEIIEGPSELLEDIIGRELGTGARV